MCQRRELFARRLVHGTLHEKRGVIDAARRNAVHHPGHLQGRRQKLPLSEAEVGKLPLVFECLCFGQNTRSRPEAACNVLSLPEAQRCRHLPDTLRPQFPPQLDKVAVAALFQSAVQPHEAVRHASGTAVDLTVQGVVAGTLPGEVPFSCFQRRCGQHRLEDRAHRIGRKSTVQKRAVRSRQALTHIGRIKVRQAHAGPHLAAGYIYNKDAPGGHALRRHPFCGPLDAAGEGQPHTLRGRVCFF